MLDLVQSAQKVLAKQKLQLAAISSTAAAPPSPTLTDGGKLTEGRKKPPQLHVADVAEEAAAIVAADPASKRPSVVQPGSLAANALRDADAERASERISRYSCASRTSLASSTTPSTTLTDTRQMLESTIEARSPLALAELHSAVPVLGQGLHSAELPHMTVRERMRISGGRMNLEEVAKQRREEALIERDKLREKQMSLQRTSGQLMRLAMQRSPGHVRSPEGSPGSPLGGNGGNSPERVRRGKTDTGAPRCSERSPSPTNPTRTNTAHTANAPLPRIAGNGSKHAGGGGGERGQFSSSGKALPRATSASLSRPSTSHKASSIGACHEPAYSSRDASGNSFHVPSRATPRATPRRAQSAFAHRLAVDPLAVGRHPFDASSARTDDPLGYDPSRFDRQSVQWDRQQGEAHCRSQRAQALPRGQAAIPSRPLSALSHGRTPSSNRAEALPYAQSNPQPRPGSLMQPQLSATTSQALNEAAMRGGGKILVTPGRRPRTATGSPGHDRSQHPHHHVRPMKHRTIVTSNHAPSRTTRHLVPRATSYHAPPRTTRHLVPRAIFRPCAIFRP